MNGDIFKFSEGAAGKNSVVEYGDLPEIPLYMDQLTTFIEDKLKGYKRAARDKILTKTMINNYTKDALLPPPERKKYDRDHIALLILIYHLKASLSINDISAIFDIMEDNKISVETVYRAFTAIQRAESEKLSERIAETKALTGKMSKDEATAAVFAILALSAESESRKLSAERLIDYIHNEGELKK